MIINHNIAALNTLNRLNAATNAQSKAMQKLSSGLRINSAADDAAGLAISEKMRAQIRGLDQASRNAQDGISLIQTAEGALNETHDILQRMRELAVQASSDTNTDEDRAEIQQEINQLTSEINRIGNTTEFNTQKLLDGSKDPSITKVTATIGGISGFTIDAGVANAGVANGLKIVFTKGATAGATFSADGKTLTVTLDQTDNAIDSSEIQSLINGADSDSNKPAGLDMTAFTVSGSGIIDGTTATVNESVSIPDGEGFQFQIGANQNQSLSLAIGDMRAVSLGISTTTATSGFTSNFTVTNGTNDTNVEYALDVSNADNASAAITRIDSAISKVSSERSKLGAVQNRLEHTINNLSTSSENLTAAESRIRDVDMAKEMMEQTKDSILAQAAQAMLAQANQQPQGVLQLLR